MPSHSCQGSSNQSIINFNGHNLVNFDQPETCSPSPVILIAHINDSHHKLEQSSGTRQHINAFSIVPGNHPPRNIRYRPTPTGTNACRSILFHSGASCISFPFPALHPHTHTPTPYATGILVTDTPHQPSIQPARSHRVLRTPGTDRLLSIAIHFPAASSSSHAQSDRQTPSS